MKRAIGALVVLGLIGGAVWLGVTRTAGPSRPSEAAATPGDAELDCDGGDAMVTDIDAAATYGSADEALAGTLDAESWGLGPGDFVAVEQARNVTTYAHAIHAETKIAISAERFDGKWAVSIIEECISYEG